MQKARGCSYPKAAKRSNEKHVTSAIYANFVESAPLLCYCVLINITMGKSICKIRKTC